MNVKSGFRSLIAEYVPLDITGALDALHSTAKNLFDTKTRKSSSEP
jgi:hypothetical protein